MFVVRSPDAPPAPPTLIKSETVAPVAPATLRLGWSIDINYTNKLCVRNICQKYASETCIRSICQKYASKTCIRCMHQVHASGAYIRCIHQKRASEACIRSMHQKHASEACIRNICKVVRCNEIQVDWLMICNLWPFSLMA